ncbi:MAG: hypothetical protein GX556_18725 [Fibrobacter sp.]|nr:hypothetical protein [Fibrobacter sp.]
MRTIFVITALALLNAQAQQPLTEQFSSKSQYNAADLAGSPLGWLETERSGSVYSDSRVAGFNTGVEASFIDGLFGINAQFFFFNDQLSKKAKGPGF